MADGIRAGDSREFNKGRSLKFYEGSRVRQTPEEGQRTYRPKRCRNNNKDEENYTGAFCCHIFYTTGTPGSVKVEYAALNIVIS